MDLPVTIGPYQVLAELGQGGMGLIYRGLDTRTRRTVAVKVLRERTDAKALERFRREIRALQQIDDPRVVRLHDTGSLPNGATYFVMDLVQGESLADRVAHTGPLAPDDAVRFCAEVARALRSAHARGILHRDVTPSNVLITPAGEVRVIDFGLARHLAPGADDLTITTSFLGTPSFWSPEQAAGDRSKVGPPTDVYGLGATLYYLLTAELPHPGDTLLELMAAMDTPPTPIAQLRDDVPPALAEVIRRCMDHDPARRPPTEGLAAELEDALIETRRGVSRSAWALVAVLVAALLALGIALGVWLARDPPTPETAATPTPAPAPGDGPDALARAIVEALKSGRVDAATRETSQTLLRLEPKRLRSVLLAGAVLEQLDRPHAALRLYTDSGLRARPPVLLRVAHLLEGIYRFGNAFHAYRRTAEQLKTDAPAGPDLELPAWRGNKRLRGRTLPTRFGEREALEHYAEYLIGRRRYPLAFTTYDALAKRHPTVARYRLERGELLRRRKEIAAARRDYQRAIALGAGAEAHAALGALALEQKDFTAAQRAFRRALALDPKLAEALNGRAHLSLRGRRLQAAKVDFEAAVGFQPSFAPAWKGLAATAKSAEKMAVWDRAVAANPKETWPLVERIRASTDPLRRAGDYAHLIALLERRRRLSQPEWELLARAYWLRAHQFELLKDHAQAAKLFQAGIRHPNHVPRPAWRGFYFDAGRNLTAAGRLEEALALHRLGYRRGDQRNFKAARTLLRRLKRTFEQSRPADAVKNPDRMPSVMVEARPDSSRAPDGFTWVRRIQTSAGGRTATVDVYRFEPFAEAFGLSPRATRPECEFVLIPGGRFVQGSPDDEPLRYAREGPQREVTVRPFLLARTELSQKVWRAMGEIPRGVQRHGKLPAQRVGWFQARAALDRYRLRFPTESEWEYACRAGTTSPFAFGPLLTLRTANFRSGGASLFNRRQRPLKKLQEVALGDPNAFGLLNMHGNVWEWTEDVFHPSYVGAPTDGRARRGSGRYRVARGGSWKQPGSGCRSAARMPAVPNYWIERIGVRPAASLD